MTDITNDLPESVNRLSFDGKEVFLVGTAHVSKESVEDVRVTIEAVKPDAVAVELCEPRYKAMTDRDNWKKMNIFKVIREKKTTFLLAQLIMSSFYRKLGEKLGVTPGAEMLEGINAAKEHGAHLILADRKIEVTLKRVWGYLTIWDKMKLIGELAGGSMDEEEISEELIEKIKTCDQLETVMAEFTEKFPEIKKRLIDERDIYLAQMIRRSAGKRIVAVVGAGHVPGIQEHIKADEDISELDEIPPKSVWPTIIKWVIPAAIIAFLVYKYYSGGSGELYKALGIWVIVNGALSAIGAAAAFGHPLAIATAFVAAPFTSVNPTLAAGWFAGIVQAWVRKPTVADFENLPNAMTTFKGFWRNPVIRVLLVTSLANLGSVIGTFLAPWLM